jgi:hypothetical protein
MSPGVTRKLIAAFAEQTLVRRGPAADRRV